MFGSKVCNVQNICMTLINTELESAFIHHNWNSLAFQESDNRISDKMLCNVAKQVQDFILKGSHPNQLIVQCIQSNDPPLQLFHWLSAEHGYLCGGWKAIWYIMAAGVDQGWVWGRSGHIPVAAVLISSDASLLSSILPVGPNKVVSAK